MNTHYLAHLLIDKFEELGAQAGSFYPKAGVCLLEACLDDMYGNGHSVDICITDTTIEVEVFKTSEFAHTNLLLREEIGCKWASEPKLAKDIVNMAINAIV